MEKTDDGSEVLTTNIQVSPYEIAYCITVLNNPQVQTKLTLFDAMTRKELNQAPAIDGLSSEEILKRFKYCLKHKTLIYKENKENK